METILLLLICYDPIEYAGFRTAGYRNYSFTSGYEVMMILVGSTSGWDVQN